MTIKNYFTCQDDIKKPEYIFSGKINFVPRLSSAIPRGSCLRIVVRENIACDSPLISEGGEGVGCDAKELASSTVFDPRFNGDGTISYKLKSNGPVVPSANIDATLNVGWCKTGDDWIKNGDYTLKEAHIVDMNENQSSYDKSLKMEKYVTQGM